MTDIAQHIRIFQADPTDDFVEKRTKAIQDIATCMRKRANIDNILQLANDLAEGLSSNGKLISETLLEEVGGAIKEQAPSFVTEGQNLQIITCAVLAAIEVVGSAPPSTRKPSRTDVLASGLWSALSFQTPVKETKLEALRKELMEKSHSLVIQSSVSARGRNQVPNIKTVATDGADWEKFSKDLKAEQDKVLSSLRDNAVLDREEIDLLWWVLSDWSEALNQKISSLPPQVGGITGGIEAACLLRRMPGDAHKHLVLRNVSAGDSYSLKEVIEAVGDSGAKLVDRFLERGALKECAAIFPLCFSLLEGKPSHKDKNEKRDLMDWSARALLEASILHVMFLPNNGI
tara:strand:- start:2419 stop:3456 length:1038 start_codon:yes stop_codon:yes gene_type:complete